MSFPSFTSPVGRTRGVCRLGLTGARGQLSTVDAGIRSRVIPVSSRAHVQRVVWRWGCGVVSRWAANGDSVDSRVLPMISVVGRPELGRDVQVCLAGVLHCPTGAHGSASVCRHLTSPVYLSRGVSVSSFVRECSIRGNVLSSRQRCFSDPSP